MWIRVIAGLALFGFASLAHAEDPEKCFQTQTARAMLRKYDYKYLGPPGVSSRTSGQEGSSKTSSMRESQSTTAGVDPGVSTGNSQSSTQFSSSFGNCNYFGMNERQSAREHFIAENLPELKRDIARGQGEHLKILAFYSACQAHVEPTLARLLRAHYRALQEAGTEVGQFSGAVDHLIESDPVLRQSCDVKA